MGLLDILNGMQNGPRGPSNPAESQGGGMSPITMALLGLLAYKAIKHMTGDQPGAVPAGNQANPLGNQASPAGGTRDSGGLGGALGGNSLSDALGGGGFGGAGGLGDLLKGGLGGLTGPGGSGGGLLGGLGGLLAGGAAGSVLSGGLNDLLKQFQQNGQSDVANSWVGKGPNKDIAPSELSKVLDEDQIAMLQQQTGLSRDQLMSAISQHLPGLIDQLTPDGRLPTAKEASQMV